MVTAEIVTRVRIDGGARVKQLVCHPTLPLVAGLDSERPAVHVWEFRAGELHQCGSIGGESAAYADTRSSEQRPPGVAWHPAQPLLLVTTQAHVVDGLLVGTQRWLLSAGTKADATAE